MYNALFIYSSTDKHSDKEWVMMRTVVKRTKVDDSQRKKTVIMLRTELTLCQNAWLFIRLVENRRIVPFQNVQYIYLDKISYRFVYTCCHPFQVTCNSLGRILFSRKACTRNVKNGWVSNEFHVIWNGGGSQYRQTDSWFFLFGRKQKKSRNVVYNYTNQQNLPTMIFSFYNPKKSGLLRITICWRALIFYDCFYLRSTDRGKYCIGMHPYRSWNVWL